MQNAAVLSKTCSRCGEEKPIEDFRPRKRARDGRHSWCDSCFTAYHAEATRRWREKNRERDRQNQRVRYAANPERGRAYVQKWRDENREEINARAREYQRRAYAENPAAFRDKNHRRRLLTEAVATPEVVDRIAYLLTQPCAYCGFEKNIEIDHVVPLSRGGTHTEENLAAACRFCNRSKKDKLVSEWRAA